jgi:hypothetical protein
MQFGIAASTISCLGSTCVAEIDCGSRTVLKDKWTWTKALHISWSICVEFGVPGLHVMPLSNCGRCTVGAMRDIHLVRLKMGCYIYFVHFSAELDIIATVGVHKALLSDSEFCKSQSSESHTLLLNINEFLDVISMLFVCFG